jgi:hypothetical protein
MKTIADSVKDDILNAIETSSYYKAITPIVVNIPILNAWRFVESQIEICDATFTESSKGTPFADVYGFHKGAEFRIYIIQGKVS